MVIRRHQYEFTRLLVAELFEMGAVVLEMTENADGCTMSNKLDFEKYVDLYVHPLPTDVSRFLPSCTFFDCV